MDNIERQEKIISPIIDKVCTGILVSFVIMSVSWNVIFVLTVGIELVMVG